MPRLIPNRHCEERSDEAIPIRSRSSEGDCFASLAMTARKQVNVITTLEVVQSGWVVDQDLAADRGAAGPELQLVQRQPVVDIEERRDRVELSAGQRGVRVRP